MAMQLGVRLQGGQQRGCAAGGGRQHSRQGARGGSNVAMWLRHVWLGCVARRGVMILPPFFSFLTHVTPRTLSFPCHLPTCTQHVPPNHGTYSHLHCTHVHYPICPCPCLVPYGCAMASYHISPTRSSMTHSSPFLYYTPSPFGMLPDPHLCHHISPSSEALCFFL